MVGRGTWTEVQSVAASGCLCLRTAWGPEVCTCRRLCPFTHWAPLPTTALEQVPEAITLRQTRVVIDTGIVKMFVQIEDT
jgi:hypothetical protein